jgi:5'-nucleotidase / UDP-sugar diphosphatase
MQRKLLVLVLLFVFSLLSVVLLTAQDEEEAPFDLTILHTNDTHAHHQPNADGDGGAAIQAAVVKQIRAEAANVVLLDGGDRFTGTLFHTVYQGQDNAQIMNLLAYDAMALGNHEFDNGDEVLAEFVNAVDFPVLAANVDFRTSPSLVSAGIEQFTVIDVNGEQVGVIGLVTPDTAEISSPSDELVFSDELVTIANGLAAILTDRGVNKIVLLTHTGVLTDFVIAPQLVGIDVFVGGHSHTLFSNQNARAAGEYPMVFSNESTGDTILYVQAGEYDTYLGRLDVTFDAAGVATAWGGDTIFLSRYITPDEEMMSLIDELAGPVEALRTEPTGATTDVALTGDRLVCRVEECNLGNLITDAYRWETDSDIAIMNGGGIRANIDTGDITFGEVLEVLPFGNTVATMDIDGASIVAALENGVSTILLNDAGQVQRAGAAGRFPQVSGLRYGYDPTLEPGSRITFVEVLQDNGSYAPIDEAAIYSLTVLNFMATGGDGYTVLAENGQNVYLYGRLDYDPVIDYLGVISPVGADDGIEVDAENPRITLVNAEMEPMPE